MNQARVAASSLEPRAGASDKARDRAIERLVRCARLSPDAATTLEWALDTLDAHGSARSDRDACQLLRAARARLDAQRTAAPDRGTRAVTEPVWV